MVAELQDTLYGDELNGAFVLKTLRDAASHIRSCQWLAGS